MKKIMKMTGAVLVCFGLVLSSFTTLNRGGDVFEIYLNSKLVLQQPLHNYKGPQTIALTSANYNDEMRIKYSHCGVVGKGRTILLKDAQDRVLRKWHFADAKGKETAMVCKVSEILDLHKSKDPLVVKLVYSSTELPKGQVLAAISGNRTLTNP